MIAKLTGRVDSTSEDSVVVDVAGVGYWVHCSGRTLAALPGVGEAVALHIETQVREDAITLFGFSSLAERGFFRVLLTVQGVGAKVALAILSVGSPDDIARAIAAGDKVPLQRASGVGPKLAARIVAELKDKVAAVSLTTPSPSPLTGALQPFAQPSSRHEDAVSALVNLGWGRMEAFAAVARAVTTLGEAAALPSLIGMALRDLGKGL